ncbi:MAG: protein-L-isoaspartate O-methyltransferase [Patescibacteria group bacterium]|nr:protein-L-isoaspartate O-methyltransferase [Patescibacteria group bacterium]MDD5490642.1 protein-L-isoaspartate O-methyltransferase [Patescibacteria group bacterium]
MSSLETLIEHLSAKGVLRSEALKETLRKVDRKNFVPADKQNLAYSDEALSLAEGQTISQPTTVVFMLEKLEISSGQKVLDIGAGSGWVSCLLGELTGEKGKVYAYEINKTVGKMGEQNVKKSGLKNVHYFITDAATSWEKNAPYDRIHSGAAFGEIPEDLKEALNIGGILVAPTSDGYIRKISRVSKNKFREEKFFGFVFVPFI